MTRTASAIEMCWTPVFVDFAYVSYIFRTNIETVPAVWFFLILKVHLQAFACVTSPNRYELIS
jgi:fumarate reductase subunit C